MPVRTGPGGRGRSTIQTDGVARWPAHTRTVRRPRRPAGPKPGADFARVSTIASVWWRKKTDVSEFLYKLLVAEAPRGYARQVAERMSVPYATLSKYWLGKRVFPAALVKPLYLATQRDARVAEFFVGARDAEPA